MANVRYSSLPQVTGLDGSEIVPLDQSDGMGGYVTRRTTAGAISNATRGNSGLGTFQYITNNTPVTVGPAVGVIIFNKAVAGASALTLGPTSARNALPLYIFDLSGNSGNIVITPDASDIKGIMGLSTFTILSGGSVLLIPAVGALGWGAMA